MTTELREDYTGTWVSPLGTKMKLEASAGSSFYWVHYDARPVYRAAAEDVAITMRSGYWTRIHPSLVVSDGL